MKRNTYIIYDWERTKTNNNSLGQLTSHHWPSFAKGKTKLKVYCCDIVVLIVLFWCFWCVKDYNVVSVYWNIVWWGCETISVSWVLFSPLPKLGQLSGCDVSNWPRECCEIPLKWRSVSDCTSPVHTMLLIGREWRLLQTVNKRQLGADKLTSRFAAIIAITVGRNLGCRTDWESCTSFCGLPLPDSWMKVIAETSSATYQNHILTNVTGSTVMAEIM